jgi:hypothetical protein
MIWNVVSVALETGAWAIELQETQRTMHFTLKVLPAILRNICLIYYVVPVNNRS